MLRAEFPVALGPLQPGIVRRSENPLEDVWNHVAWLGTEPKPIDSPWASLATMIAHEKFWKVRVRQAVQFRESGSASSFLTRPLTLYYSLLNLTRAAAFLREQVIRDVDAPTLEHADYHQLAKRLTSGHGLHGKRAWTGDVLDYPATVDNKGTYVELCRAADTTHETGRPITLRECLGNLPEMLDERFGDIQSNVVRFGIRASLAGGEVKILLFVNGNGYSVYPENSFAERWQDDFPGLVNECECEQRNVLRIKSYQGAHDSKSIRDFCEEFCQRHFLPSLHLSGEPCFFAVKNRRSNPAASRLPLYFGGAFILSSLVRYEPELVFQERDSRIGWHIARFLAAAERYYPQVLLSWMWKYDHYFEHF